MVQSDQHRQNGSGQVQYEAKAVEDTGARHRDLRVSAPVQVGQEVVLTIDGLSSTGEGVGRTRGFAVFVPGALVGEEIVCTVESVKKSYARATLDRVITPSQERIEPACDLYPMILNHEDGISISPKAKIGYFAQNGYKYNSNQNVLEFMQEDCDYNVSEIRSVLASMGVKQNDIGKSLSVLSGGEIIKLLLAKMLMGRYNIVFIYIVLSKH
jgi:predicted RNA-binding protein with TRAM domain